MTLNSHVPVNADQAPAYDCPAGYPSGVCLQLGYVRVTLESVAAMAADRALPPTTFVLVGEHAAPYMDDAKRNLFESGVVPYLVLQPKEGNSIPTQPSLEPVYGDGTQAFVSRQAPPRLRTHFS